MVLLNINFIGLVYVIVYLFTKCMYFSAAMSAIIKMPKGKRKEKIPDGKYSKRMVLP